MERLKTILRLIFSNNQSVTKNNVSKDRLFYTKDFFKETKFIIGNYTYGKPNVIFKNNETNLHIGKFCSIANNVTIFLGGNHRTDFVTTYPFNSIPTNDFDNFKHLEGHPATKGDVKIGNDVWIGLNSVILSGVTIDDGAVIAANSVITKNVGAYEIWGGNPAKFIKKRFSDEQINQLLKIKWWNWEINKIKMNVENLMNTDLENFLQNN